MKTVFTAEELAGMVTQARSEGLLGSEQYSRIDAALGLATGPPRTRCGPGPGSPRWPTTRRRPPSRRWPPAPAGRGSRWCSGRPGGCWASCTSRTSSGTRVPQRRAADPAEIIRPLAVVPPDRTLADLLLTMRRDRRHIVLVSDGRRPLGVITLDDVLHAVVGEPAHAVAAAPSRSRP